MTAFEEAKELFLEALTFIDAGEFTKAEPLLRDALRSFPTNVQILTNLAIVLVEQREYAEALRYAEQAISSKPNDIDALSIAGFCHAHAGDFGKALSLYDKIVALAPDNADIQNRRGVILAKLGRLPEALDSYERAIALQPNDGAAYSNRGNVLRELKRHAEALDSFVAAVERQPQLAAAWLGRGNTLLELQDYGTALTAYAKAVTLNAGLAEAWLGQGNVFDKLGRRGEALTAYDKALACEPMLASAHLGRGNVLCAMDRFEDASGAYETALRLNTSLAEAEFGLGNVHFAARRYAKASAAYDKAFSLKPDLPELAGVRLHSKQHACDWTDFDAEAARLLHFVRTTSISIPPFTILAIPSTPSDQLRCATVYGAERRSRRSEGTGHYTARRSRGRIRLGYFSADFHQHATSHLMVRMFELHDKSKFELVAFSFGPNIQDDMRRRLVNAFDDFIEVGNHTDREIVDRAREREIDIAVDLKGFTEHGRPAVFAMRVAPVQISYLGYPGTMGPGFADYLIADRTLIPESQRCFYTEKIIYMPNSYQVNDCERLISTRPFSREDVGLPPEGFVFCCFNNNYKIVPDVFDSWMRVLDAVNGSVLWLLGDNLDSIANLRRAAEARGLSGDRLVFAGRMPAPDHLARHRLADLFLDTLPYNAHTTASDALWVGVPVLTHAGETFAGRVAASLLGAVGLPELVTSTRRDYERVAIELASVPNATLSLKRKLASRRDDAPLFDTGRFTQAIEQAYTIVHHHFCSALPPDHVEVPS